MNTKVMIGLTLLTFALAACGGQTTPTPPTAAPTEAQAQPTMAPTPTPVPPTESATATAIEPTAEAPTESAVAGGVSYANDIKPIFGNSCIGCHGGDQTRAGLDLKTYESLMAGSVNGAVVVAGNPGESWLVKLTAEGKMPKRGDKLTPEQVQLISDWIAAGALNN